MKLTKRIFSSVMALLIVFSAFSVGFTTTASGVSTTFFEEIVLTPVERPDVIFTCSPVTRVAKAANSVEPGNKIVKATPSGVPELSGSYKAQAYAGETPSATKLTFKSNTDGVTVNGITCSNNTVKLSSLVYNSSSGTYTCEVTGGTAEAGSALIFTIDYSWTDGNAYQEKCVSFVEGIANGGSFAEAKCDITSNTSLLERYVAMAAANTRVLGKNVYYEQPANMSTSSEHPYSTYGVYNPATGEFIENVASGYNTSIYKEEHVEDVWLWADKNVEVFTTGTTVAHVYIDSSSITKLSDLGLRININVGNLIDTGKSTPYTAIADTWVSSGANVTKAVTTNNSTAQNTLGITIPAKKDNGVKQFEKNATMTTVTKGIGSYQELYTYRLNGSIANITDGSSYTVTSKYYSYMFNGGLLGFNLTSSATVPTAMTFHMVDKGALRELIEYVMTNDPDTPSTRTQKKGVNPQGWYYRSGFSQFQTAYADALRVLNNPKATQSEIDSAARSLQTMYNNLQLKTADYTRVNALYDIADELIAHEEDYDAEAVELVREAQLMVTKSYSILYQGAVDAMARNLQKAIENAHPDGADYLEIYEMKVQFEELNEIDYTPASWQAVEDAFAAVDYTKTVLEQDKVDAMAEAVRDAFEKLELIPADFAALSLKLQEAKEINSDFYVDSSALLEAIANAEAAVADNETNPWGTSRQSEVDALTTALDDAINALVLKGADKENLKAAIDAELSDTPEYYNQDILAEYQALVAAGTEMYNDDTLTIRNQAEIDAMTESITAKYEELTDSYVVPCDHVEGEAVDENVVAPTCTENGSCDKVVYCTLCNTELSRETVVIETSGHTLEINEAVAPDCVNTGLTAGEYCSVCGEIFVAQEVVDALGHTDGEAVKENEVAADCVNDGSYDMVVYCSVCGEELSRESFVIEALGHTAGEAVEENRIDATCTEAGSYDMVVYCTCCEEKVELSRDTYEIDALGHTEAEAVEENRVEATYEQAGSYDSVVYCTVCGEELSRETIVIPQLQGYFKAAEGSTTVIDEKLGYIYGLDIGLADLEGYVEYSSSVSYETPDGIGTGMTLTTFRGGAEWETYTIIIFGDLNGDGVIDIYDASVLAAIVNGDMELEEGDPILFAADLNGDTAVDIYDLAILNAVVNGETEITQVPLA